MTTEEFIGKIPFAKKAEVIAHDENGLIAINKGAGLMSHPNPKPKRNEPSSFVRAPYNFQREYFSWQDDNGGKLRLHLINRLDSPTSGVILAASNMETALAARAAFKEKAAKKIYYAICKGRPPENKGLWQDCIKKTVNAGNVRASAEPHGAALAKTEYSMVRMDANGLGVSLMALEPVTGKTHQLRIQCSRRNLPIVGDATYGDFNLNKKVRTLTEIGRLFLHCFSTAIEYELDGMEYAFSAEAPMPESFSTIMDYNANIFSTMKGFK